MIQGIPYFGENTQAIYELIQNENANNQEITKITHESLYELIKNNIDKKLIIVIDNKWFSWLNDIVFNYRDKKCYIPYYSYKLHKLDNKKYRSNNNGHLILKESALYIRYEYKYNKLDINMNNLVLNLFDIDTMKQYRVHINKWINENEFSIDYLYKLYINSSFMEDDFELNKHSGGYHYIDKQPKQFKNKEKQIREAYGLRTYDNSFKYEKDYRDVRNFKYEEVIKRYGIPDDTDLYKLRRLKFESYLYCILRQHILSDNLLFNKRFNSLYNEKDYIKYGDNIKLIFKNYWLDNQSSRRKRSWSRV